MLRKVRKNVFLILLASLCKVLIVKKKAVLICFIISMFLVNGCGIRGTDLSELTNINYNNIVSIDFSSHFCQSYSNSMKKELFEEFFDIINVKYEDSEKKELECSSYATATYRIALSDSIYSMLIVRLSSGKLYCEYFNDNYIQCFLSTSKVNIPLKFTRLQ